MDGRNVFAKAVFDNIAETGDELEFHRGDIIKILEQNTSGLEGWWLCSLHGKQGIAPGNRLRILSRVHEPPSPSLSGQEVYDVPPTHAWSRLAKPMFDDQDDEYDIPRKQPQIQYAVTNEPNSPTEIYDIPRASNWQQLRQASDDVYDIPPSAVPYHSQQDVEQEVYNVPSNLLSVKPQSNPMLIYDVPPVVSRGPQQSSQYPEEVYDVPPRRPEQLAGAALIDVQQLEEVYDVPASVRRSSPYASRETVQMSHTQPLTDVDVVYDIPQSNRTSPHCNIPSGLNSLRRMRRGVRKSDKMPSASSRPEPVDYIYDVPPQVTRDHNQSLAKSNDDVVDGLLRRLSLASNPADPKVNNRLSTISKDSISSFIDDNPLQYSELKLDFNTATSELIELKGNLEDTVSKLLTMVKQNWRKRENIAGKLHEIQKCFLEILVTVNQFLIFARGSTANAFVTESNGESRAPKSVQSGLRKLLIPVEEDAEMLKRALAELEECNWDIDKLCLDDGADDGIALDEVDSFVMSSRAVSDDASQMAVFIHTHAQFIFKKYVDQQPNRSQQVVKVDTEKDRPIHDIHALQARPLPSVPLSGQVTTVASAIATTASQEEWLEDYDYVALEDLDQDVKNNERSGGSLSGLNKRRTQLIALEKEWSPSLTQTESNKLSTVEKSSLFQLQIDVPVLMKGLGDSIDSFITAVDKGNPPNSFVALGKQVIFCAHKLVFAGDIVNLHISLPSVKSAIQNHCEDLCAAMKHAVVFVKLGALQWPAVSAVQEMVDRMCEISKCAHQMRLTMLSVLHS